MPREPLPPPRLRCAVESSEYPLFAARLLDALEFSRGDYRAAAARWGVSPTSLLRLVERDPLLWNWLTARYPDDRRRGGTDAGDADQ